MTLLRIRSLLPATLLFAGCPAPIECPAGSTATPEGRCIEGDAGPETDATAGLDAGLRDAHAFVDAPTQAPDAAIEPPVDAPASDAPGAVPDAWRAPDAPLPDAPPLPDACTPVTYYADADSDGFGAAAMARVACAPLAGYVTDSRDCDDTRATSYPGATETCNERDDNCNGSTDEGVQSRFYADLDADGYGTGAAILACTAPARTATRDGDCDDTRGTSYPGAREECNGLSDDCDAAVDEGVLAMYYTDGDRDGYGTGTAVLACSAPPGTSMRPGDCDDTRMTTYPTAPEHCNGRDDDCVGTGDTGGTSPHACTQGAPTPCTTTCGSMGTGTCSALCTAPTAAACTPPGETCNGRDDDCDGRVDQARWAIGPRSTVQAGAFAAPYVFTMPDGDTGVLYRDAASPYPAPLRLARIDAAGAVTPVPLPSLRTNSNHSAALAGSTIAVAHTHPTDALSSALTGLRSDGTQAWTLPLPHRATVIADATPTRVTLFAITASNVLERLQVDVSGASPSIVNTTPVVTGIVYSRPLAALTAAGFNYIAYAASSSSGGVLVRTAAGDAPGVPQVLSTPIPTSHDTYQLALAMRDRSVGPSTANPLAIAWQSSAGTYYRTIIGTGTADMTSQRMISASPQVHSGLLLPSGVTLSLVSAPAPSAGTPSPQFYLFAGLDDPTTSDAQRGTLGAWELTGSTERALTVPDNTVRSMERVSAVSTPTGIRVGDTLSGIILRPVGCF